MKDELGWGDTFVKCSWGQDTMPTVSCPRGQDKPGGGGTFYPSEKCPMRQDITGILFPGDKIQWGQDKQVHLFESYLVGNPEDRFSHDVVQVIYSIMIFY